MPFPRKLLNEYETVALDLHPHWWYFAEPAGALVGSIVVGVVLKVSSLDTSAESVERVLSLVVLALIVICALWLVVRYLKWATTNFVITSDRLIFRQGVLAKSGIEIPLERVNNVNFSQSIFERVLGAGDLVIESGGEDGKSRFTDIRRPERVQNLIHSQMEENERRRGQALYPIPPAAPPATPPAAPDVATQLEKLEGLLQRGTLTGEEFDAQKRKLLGGGAPLPPPAPPTAPPPSATA